MNKRTLFVPFIGSILSVCGGIPGTSWAQETPTLTEVTPPGKAYYVAEFELKDPEGIRPYSTNVASTFTPFGGKFIVRAGKVIALEGKGPASRTVVIEFPSLERAQAWYNSPAYRDLRPIRQKSGISRTYIIEGVSS